MAIIALQKRSSFSLLTSLVCSLFTFSQTAFASSSGENVSTAHGSDDVIYTVGSLSNLNVSPILQYLQIKDDDVTQSLKIESHITQGQIFFAEEVKVEVFNTSGQSLYRSGQFDDVFDLKLLGQNPQTLILVLTTQAGKKSRQKWIAQPSGAQ